MVWGCPTASSVGRTARPMLLAVPIQLCGPAEPSGGTWRRPPSILGSNSTSAGQHQQPPFSAQRRSEPGPCAGCVTTPFGPSSPQDCKPAAKASRQPRAPGSSSRPPAQLGPRSSDTRSSSPTGARLEPRSPQLEPQGPRGRPAAPRQQQALRKSCVQGELGTSLFPPLISLLAA